MGIQKGVTLIVGGGFHGKSTLLQAARPQRAPNKRRSSKERGSMTRHTQPIGQGKGIGCLTCVHQALQLGIYNKVAAFLQTRVSVW